MARQLVLGLSLATTASACNGDASFCQLPFNKFTFAGTHNSGSFDLNIPEIIEDDIPLVDVNDILKCYYDVHHMNYLEQLNFGIRFFYPDVCTRASGELNTFYDCHSSSGYRESGMGWGTKFGDQIQVMKDWLSIRPREMLMVVPDNMHYNETGNHPDRTYTWMNHFAEKFGSCIVIDSSTQISQLTRQWETACVRLEGRPEDNITMGDLIDRNLRMIVVSPTAPAMIKKTYSSANVGAKTADLLQVFDDFASGVTPMPPQQWMSLALYGSAAAPDFSMVDMSKPYDPIWPVVATLGALKKTDLRCVERQATSYNTEALQDDSNPNKFFADKECPDSICGCLGYKSPLEPIHQKFLDQGHSVLVVLNDYSELGEKQHIAQVTKRMNLANLRRFLQQPEPVKTWWDCNWATVVAIAIPLALMSCCCCYATLVCLFPERYGIWIRKAWERHQEARAQKRMGREQGREEARAYLRNANGLSPNGVPVQSVGVTSVAPPAALQMEYNSHSGFYQAKETE